MQELLLLLIPRVGEPRISGQGSGMGSGETPGVPAQEAEAGERGLLHDPMGEFSVVRASISGFSGALSSAPAVPPRLGRGLQGLYFQL